MNTYAYAGLNPINFIDFYGLCACKDNSPWDFDKLEDAYQKSTDMIEGKNFSPKWAEKAMLDPINGGTCGARLSNAFNSAGYDIIDKIVKDNKNTKYFNTLRDQNRNLYILGAAHLAKGLGVVKNKYRISSVESIKGKRGIIYFENFHIDLYNGSFLVGNTGAINGDRRYKLKPMYFKELKRCDCNGVQ